MAPQESNIIPGNKRQSQFEDLFSLTLSKKAKKKRKKNKGSSDDQQRSAVNVPDVITLDSDDSGPNERDDDVIFIEPPVEEIDLSVHEIQTIDYAESTEDNIVINTHQPLDVNRLISETSEPQTSSSVLYYKEETTGSVALETDYPKSWTKDMIDFYTKPNEKYRNFDYEKIIHKMKTKPSDWFINASDKYGTPKQKKNYQQCRKCRRNGHIERECKKNIVCYICGEFNHIYLRCPNALCLMCGKRTSRNVTSCNNCQEVLTNKIPCNLCGQLYHIERMCPSKWRQYLLLSDSTQPAIPNRRKFCYNCAGSGHFGFECSLTPYSDYPPENPFITSLVSHSFSYEETDDDNNNYRNTIITLSQETTNLLKTEEGSVFLKQFSDSQNARVEFCYGLNNYVKFNRQKIEVTAFRKQLNEWKTQFSAVTLT